MQHNDTFLVLDEGVKVSFYIIYQVVVFGDIVGGRF